VDIHLSDEDRLYNEGFDDGLAGRSKRSFEESYLEGYYDGLREAEECDEIEFYEDDCD